MPMSDEERRLSEFMRQHCYDQYLISCEGNGGHINGYVNFVTSIYRKQPDKFPYLAVIAKCAREDWGTKAPWERDAADADDEGNQYVLGLNEVRLPKGITTPDPAVHGGFRRVHRDFATIAQHREHCLLRLRNAARVGAAAERDMQANDWASKQAKGDRSKKIIDFATKVPPRADAA